MKLKQFLQNSTSGFTIIELLVSTFIGLMISSIALSVLVGQKQFYETEVVRAKTNQDLRSVFEIITAELRLAGENLPSNFPAIILTDAVGPDSDAIKIRRNLLDEVLKLCMDINSGDTDSILKFSEDSTETSPNPPACGYNVNGDNYTAWYDYWQEQGGANVTAYMYNIQSRLGEYFDFNDVQSDVISYKLIKSSSDPWVNSYTQGNAWIYIIEEWEIKLENGFLRIVDTEDTSNYINLANDISAIEITLTMQDDTELTSFTKDDDWTAIKTINFTITSGDTVGDQTVQRSWTAQIFPRNILSTVS